MAKHLSLRLAWHNNGWNGHICENPKSNIYCVGKQSYPSTHIANNRDLEWEDENKGKDCSKCSQVVACSYSINAFGKATIKSEIIPPPFYDKCTQIKKIDIQPYSALTWPYENMFESGELRYDYNRKLNHVKTFFKELAPDKSLVFYYANKSNPFSGDDSKIYVLVGIGRVKQVGEIMYFDNVSKKDSDRYAGGFIWECPITSNYPNEGFQIPYHKYMDNEEVLNHILYIPEQSNNFKYAAKHINDDDALIYIEHLLNIVQYLIDIKDDTENWEERKKWLQSLLAELWISRGCYPGMAALLDFLDCGELISYYYQEANNNKSKLAGESIISFFETKDKIKLQNCSIPNNILGDYCRNWYTKLENKNIRELAKLLARVAIGKQQIKNLISDNRAENGINSQISEIINNLYIISEQYIGNDIGDEIPFSKIDHAVLPSPDLGLENLYSKHDWRRLRALMVNELKFETIHSFVNQETILDKLNKKLVHYPDWKKEVFNDGFIEYDKNQLEKAITFRIKDDKTYLYLNEVFNDERFIEENIKELIGRGDVKILKPYSAEKWKNQLFQTNSPLAKNALVEYEQAIEGQTNICSQIFSKTVSIIAGSAGTGKTTAVKAILNAINFTSNNTESICLLAPTGKAADRLRQKSGANAQTIHSFLTKNQWLNFNNWTLKQSSGRKCCDYTTYIIDESSMIDLHLMSGLFRAIDWDVVRRIIFVGDPNQLPPIGRGKVFKDIIEYVKATYPDNYGELTINIRQMENTVLKKGTGILDIANLYIQQDKNQDYKQKQEEILKLIQESDENVCQDLRIVTWQDTDDLEKKLTDFINSDLEQDNTDDMMQHQIISPYRGELFGTDNINLIVQELLNKENLNKFGNLFGITVGDKIIQITNRANSNAYWKNVDVFNGELGKVTFFKKGDGLTLAFENKSQLVKIGGESEVENNIELGYAISVHKAQGSEFERVYFILPKNKQTLLSTELLYTGITRAQKHLTIFVEGDFTTLLTMTRPEKSRIKLINSSVFDFDPLHEELLTTRWYEEGKIHSTLTDYLVRSKSEVIIANMLFENGIENLKYEEPLFAPDGTFYLPDFTIKWKGKTYYWEHLGMLDVDKYKRHWEEKEKWYNKHFAGQLITTEECTELSKNVKEFIGKIKRNEI